MDKDTVIYHNMGESQLCSVKEKRWKGVLVDFIYIIHLYYKKIRGTESKLMIANGWGRGRVRKGVEGRNYKAWKYYWK